MSTRLALRNNVEILNAGQPTGSTRIRSGTVFYFGLALVFIRFAMIHQIIASVIGTNFFMLYWIGIPTIVGLILSGGFRRALSTWPARYWLLFGLWATIAIPFSSWPGGSLQLMLVYWRIELLMLFVIAGIVTNWRECRLVLLAIAVATFINLVGSRLFGQADPNERFSFTLSTSSVDNPNDFAAHLIFVLPFVLWLAMSARSVLAKIVCFGALSYGAYVTLATGSRGVVVALAADILFLLFFSPRRRRLQLLVLAVLLLGVAIVILPVRTWDRIASIYRTTDVPEEAIESKMTRKYLLEKSIDYTFEHPLLGVGPGQFPNYEGKESRSAGQRGAWHQTHNSYTEASSETGIPGGIFFLLGTVSAFVLLTRTARRAEREAQSREVLSALFCLRLSFVGIATAVFFVNFAYYFYLPAITGLALAITTAIGSPANKELSVDSSAHSRKRRKIIRPLVPA
jgi:O-antigen ligase